MGPMGGGGKERRGVRGEREITVRESVNEKERAHEIPKWKIEGKNFGEILWEGKSGREKFVYCRWKIISDFL